MRRSCNHREQRVFPRGQDVANHLESWKGAISTRGIGIDVLEAVGKDPASIVQWSMRTAPSHEALVIEMPTVSHL